MQLPKPTKPLHTRGSYAISRMRRWLTQILSLRIKSAEKMCRKSRESISATSINCRYVHLQRYGIFSPLCCEGAGPAAPYIFN